MKLTIIYLDKTKEIYYMIHRVYTSYGTLHIYWYDSFGQELTKSFKSEKIRMIYTAIERGMK